MKAISLMKEHDLNQTQSGHCSLLTHHVLDGSNGAPLRSRALGCMAALGVSRSSPRFVVGLLPPLPPLKQNTPKKQNGIVRSAPRTS